MFCGQMWWAIGRGRVWPLQKEADHPITSTHHGLIALAFSGFYIATFATAQTPNCNTPVVEAATDVTRPKGTEQPALVTSLPSFLGDGHGHVIALLLLSLFPLVTVHRLFSHNDHSRRTRCHWGWNSDDYDSSVSLPSISFTSITAVK